jgi:hypothetical protein
MLVSKNSCDVKPDISYFSEVNARDAPDTIVMHVVQLSCTNMIINQLYVCPELVENKVI